MPTMRESPKSALMKSRNSSTPSSLMTSSSLSHSSSESAIHLSCTLLAVLSLDPTWPLQCLSYGRSAPLSVLPDATAPAATSPAFLPNLMAYLMPSRTSGFACPAESPTRIMLLKTVFRDVPSFGISP